MGYSYSAPQWLLVFFLYCVLGWCFESTVVSVKQRHFVNRGFLRGPMLPIYGFGAVLLLHVSLPLYDRPAMTFPPWESLRGCAGPERAACPPRSSAV